MFEAVRPPIKIHKGRKSSFIPWDDEEDATLPEDRRGQKIYWLVVKDPSGDFLGRSFRSYDLNAPENYWAVGTVFENQRTGVRKRWTRKGFVKEGK